MDDFANILQRDYGLKPQGKSAPMTSVKPSGPSPFSSSSPASTPASIQRTSSVPKPKNGSNRNSRSSNPILGESLDEEFFFGSSNGFPAPRSTYGSAPSDMPAMYDDVFGGPPKFAAPSYPPMPSSSAQQNSSSQSYDDIFRMPVKPSSTTSSSSNKGSSFPVFDAPLYDDDIFGGVPGIRSTGVVYEDVFSGGSTVGTSPSVLEDLLGVSETRERTSGFQQPIFDSSAPLSGLSTFDDLLPGFEPLKPRPAGVEKPSENSYTGPEKNSFGMSPNDPFEVIHVDDPFNVPQSAGQASFSQFSDSEPMRGPAQSSGSHRRQYSNGDQSDSIDGSGNSSPHLFKTQSPSRETMHSSKSRNQTTSSPPSHTTVVEEDSVNRHQSRSNGMNEHIRDSSSPKPPERSEAPSFHSPIRRGRQVYDDVEEPVRLPKVAESRQADEYWISVEDVKLVTEPTAGPPPSRRPPLPGSKHGHTSRRAAGLRGESSFKESSSRHESPQSGKLSSSRGASEFSNRSTATNNASNPYDELEQFASGVSRARKETKMDMSAPTLNEEMMEGSAAASASAMAMKEAMERARSKLRERGKEERESGLRAEETLEDHKEAKDDGEEKLREAEERQRAREKEEREMEAKALHEREEREKRRREREKEREIEREREREREREKDRIAFERAAVERANAEARERLAAEARQRAAAERAAAEAREQAAATEARERAAVEKVTAEARERAAAEARERVAAEARERAAAEAREKAAAERAAVDRAAAEARERAAAEARERVSAERAASEARARAERAFVERVNAEARERAAEKAAAEAREKAAAERAASEARERAAAERAAAAREQQRRSENDFEAFFASSARPASAPRQRSPATGTSDGRQSSKGFSTEGSQRTSTAAPSARKATPTSSTDDWTSLFGPAVPAAGEFQEVEGESAERRRARLDRHQRTAERAAKALDQKNQRDLQSQREQAERHRAGEMLDAEIKRWAAGKEGNLRALLSTLHYVLWPECGWQAVSLTDVITAAAVKKVYRKATLCVHPDKVQQKGATIQQKYIAEKVFDLLKEAWNKFNSEELF
ncbi:hypothetical protein GOP47_0019240 [Adiantum capillus-veneris]|uniref:Uncharacterized protein n=1 Tax=Adiantum capillus-veneris TaxID=13818 RepID=A0A9D4UDP8_ADICA|nr:hypothetical protein GOP47_0018519 [Adiantum capillus-veneris]KAI5066616.1 hypothetical protein GOP47_0019240 [Adiantum capillus-veneris]